MKIITIKKIPFELTWSIRHQAMWPNKPIDYVKLPKEETGIHFGLFVHDQLVSVVSAFIVNNEAQFRKFATLEAEQGKGYGTQLLTHLFTELESAPIAKIWCNARISKTAFYEGFGMMKTTADFSKGGIDYVVMVKI